MQLFGNSSFKTSVVIQKEASVFFAISLYFLEWKKVMSFSLDVNKSLISILGGGDTISAINKIEKKLSFTHLSTAGGAFLEYLEGKDLPGLSVLK